MARQMTEEQKRANAQRLAAARAQKAEEKAEAEEPKREVEPEETKAQPIFQMVAPKEPDVKILYVDSALPNNEISIGPGRVVSGSGRIFTVPLSFFEGEFQNPLRTTLINHRNFIVLSGLNDEQRKQYNCDYREGEVIRSEGTFDYLFRCPVEEAKTIFEALCREHREMVAHRFAAAYESGDNRVTRDRVEALNEISKNDYEDGKGAFTEMLKAINKI